MRIRQATLADLDALVDGNQRLAMETEALQLPTDTLSAGVTTLLTHPEYGHYWVAEDSGVICGQLMITFEWSDWRNGLLWWLQSVYVWPNMRQQGVFSALLTRVMDDAKRIGIPESDCMRKLPIRLLIAPMRGTVLPVATTACTAKYSPQPSNALFWHIFRFLAGLNQISTGFCCAMRNDGAFSSHPSISRTNTVY